jgi:hypothetical protein
VFGPGAILEADYDVPHALIRGITVDHLLIHAAGGWSSGRDDPMFANNLLNRQELIA